MSYLKDRLSPSLFVESVPVEVEKKTFTPDLKGLIAWLETQEPSKEYAHMDPKDCLLCRFSSAIAGRVVTFGGAVDLIPMQHFMGLCKVAYSGGRNGIHSYRDVLARARDALARS